MKAWMVIFLVLAACTQRPAPEQIAADETVPSVTQNVSGEVQLIPSSPDMIAASLTGDPNKMAAVIQLAAACHAPSTCPAQFSSCGTWSSFATCGDRFCTGGCVRPPRCAPDNPDCLFSQQFGQTSESFRVCFNAAQNGCTEWRNQTAVTGCGCGGFE